MVPFDLLAAYPDPGEPPKKDREAVLVKSGPSKGRLWRRKPRLQVRLAAGYEIPMLRRALGVALAMDDGEINVSLDGPALGAAVAGGFWTPEMKDRRKQHPSRDRPGTSSGPVQETGQRPKNPLQNPAQEDEEIVRLRAIVSVLSFDPLKGGIKTRDQALHVLGLAPGAAPDIGKLRARFRMLAAIHHPDSGYGDHERMSQLNSAMDILGRGA